MTTTSARPRRPVAWPQVAGVLAVAVLSALQWYAWLGWDSRYQVDPVTGVASGPYEPWQVIGCGLSLLAVFVGALLVGVRPLAASAALTLAFTGAWARHAAGVDETGLYGVGVAMLLAGLTFGTTVVWFVMAGLRRLWAARRRS